MTNKFYIVSFVDSELLTVLEKPLHMVEEISNTENRHSCILESEIDAILRNPLRKVRVKRSTEILARVLQENIHSNGSVPIGCICRTKKGKIIFLFDYDIENIFFKYDQDFFHFMLDEIQKYIPLS